MRRSDKNKTKIIHIIPTLNFGGAERFVVDLVNNSEKFDYSILVFKNEIPLAKEILKSDVKAHILEKKNLFGFVKDLKNKLKELQPDIVHTHLFGGDVYGRLAAHKLNIPVVTTEHNFNTGEGLVKNKIKKHFRNYSDKYIACSEGVKKYMQEVYKIKKDIQVIRYGIDLERFKNIKPLRVNKKINFLLLGRLVEQKGYDIALKILAKLKEYDWELTIVGEGDQERVLKSLVEKLDIKNRVTFLPPTHDVPGIFDNVDVMLMPSRWEGLGIVIMEAMVAGRLVIGSRVGGIPELIKHGENGLLVEPGNVEAWIGQLSEVFEDEEKYYALGEKAKAYAKNNFGIEQMVKSYEDIYEEAEDSRLKIQD